MPARAERCATIGKRKCDDGDEDRNQPVPAGRPEEAAQRDQRLGEPRQRLPALLVNGDDLRHHVGEQHGDHRKRDRRHQRRIDQRQRELLAQGIACFQIIGEAGEHLGQPPGLGANANEPAIELGKCAGKTRHRRG